MKWAIERPEWIERLDTPPASITARSARGCSGDRMPELPDLTVYLEALEPRVLGQPLERVRLASISLLRSVEPPARPSSTAAASSALRRLGKRWCSASRATSSSSCT